MTTSKPTGPAMQSKISDLELEEAKVILRKMMAKGLITIRPGIPAKPDHEKKEAVQKMLATKARNRLKIVEPVIEVVQ